MHMIPASRTLSATTCSWQVLAESVPLKWITVESARSRQIKSGWPSNESYKLSVEERLRRDDPEFAAAYVRILPTKTLAYSVSQYI